jgi:glycosyltransferase involved in cell wall biosynthesis
MRVGFVHCFATHYTKRTFELLAERCDVEFLFFSGGDVHYWPAEHGVQKGSFVYEYLSGFDIVGTRIVPSLPGKLLRGNYDLIVKCVNGRFALPIAYLAARLRHRPFILWTGIWSRIRTPFHSLFFPAIHYIYRHADAIMVYGEHVKSYLVTEGVRPERIFVAPHAIDNGSYSRIVPEAERLEIRQLLGIPQDKKVILYLGRLVTAKGVNILIESLAKVRPTDAVLVIAGKGPEKGALEDLVARHELAGLVRFAGYIPIEKATAYYSLAYVLVLPSISTATFREPWGLVVNEAMNQGVPVIATDAVGAAAGGLLQDNVNGFVVPEQDVSELAQSLKRILDDTELRSRFSKNAKKIINGWNQERMAERFMEAFEFVLSEKHPVRRQGREAQ